MAKNPPKSNVSPLKPAPDKQAADDAKARAAKDAAVGGPPEDESESGGEDTVADGVIIGAIIGLPVGQPVLGAVIGGLIDSSVDADTDTDELDVEFAEGRTHITAPIPIKNAEGEVVRVIKGSGSQQIRNLPFVGDDLGDLIDAGARNNTIYGARLRAAIDSDPTIAPSGPRTPTPAAGSPSGKAGGIGMNPRGEFQATPEEMKAAEQKYLGNTPTPDDPAEEDTSVRPGTAPPAGEDEPWDPADDDGPGEPDNDPDPDPDSDTGAGAGAGAGGGGGQPATDEDGGPPPGSEAFTFDVIRATGTVDGDEFEETSTSTASETVYRDEDGNWYDSEGNALPAGDAAAYEEAYQEDGLATNRAPEQDVPPEEEVDEETEQDPEGEKDGEKDGGGVGYTPDPDGVDVLDQLPDIFGIGPTRGSGLTGRGSGSSTGDGVTDPPEDDGSAVAAGTVAVDPHAELLDMLGNPGTAGGPSDFGSGSDGGPGTDYTSSHGAGVTDPADDADAAPVTDGPEERGGSAPPLDPSAAPEPDESDDAGGMSLSFERSGILGPVDHVPDEFEDMVIDQDL